jgi:capping protein alpha
LSPVLVKDSQFGCLITEFNDLGGGRFADPRSKQSFKYDHLRKEASDFQVVEY